MLNVRGLGSLAVAAAVGLAGVLVVACSERNPTSPDGAGAPSLAPTKAGYYDDARRIGSCGNDRLLRPTDGEYADAYDLNGNDIICLKTTGPGPKK